LLFLFDGSIDDVVKKIEGRTTIQGGSLAKEHTMDKYDDHCLVGTNPNKKSLSAATSSGLASTSRISANKASTILRL
jgi:phage gpG-like protein